jgi:hypothetical protein
MTPPALNKHAISPTRRTDSARSAGEKPKSRFRPVRTASQEQEHTHGKKGKKKNSRGHDSAAKKQYRNRLFTDSH